MHLLLVCVIVFGIMVPSSWLLSELHLLSPSCFSRTSQHALGWKGPLQISQSSPRAVEGAVKRGNSINVRGVCLPCNLAGYCLYWFLVPESRISQHGCYTLFLSTALSAAGPSPWTRSAGEREVRGLCPSTRVEATVTPVNTRRR